MSRIPLSILCLLWTGFLNFQQPPLISSDTVFFLVLRSLNNVNPDLLLTAYRVTAISVVDFNVRFYGSPTTALSGVLLPIRTESNCTLVGLEPTLLLWTPGARFQ